jgi:hypothetical protein
MEAFLHYHNKHVEFNGELIVVGARDPLPTMARTLLAQGITGKITVRDAVTRKPRLVVDIEGAAKIRTDDLRMAFVRWKPFELASVSPESSETEEGGQMVP